MKYQSNNQNTFIVHCQEYTYADVQKYLDRVVDLAPWTEFSQEELLKYVVPSKILSQVGKYEFCLAWL